jgi:6-phosphogluconolactonase (cycloisomerase 2 family)
MLLRDLNMSVGALRLALFAAVSGALLAACSGVPNGTPNNPSTVSVGGTVAGLATGASLVLQNNGGDSTTVSASGPFSMATMVAANSAYAVTVSTQPANPAQTCTVANGSGTAAVNVTGITVTCVTRTFTLGGSVTGLATGASLVLSNGATTLPLSANGAFSFPVPIAGGTVYAVTVSTQPTTPVQTCTVTNGSGTITANVTNVTVTCVTGGFTLGGTVTGLTGTGLVLANGAATLGITANGTFTFPTPLATGTAYAVAVQTQPTGQTCSVANGSGTIGTASVSNVAVTCAAIPPGSRTIGGTVSGLAGTGLVLQNNGGNSLAVAGNGGFTFSTALTVGATYAVTVLTQPSSPTQTCAVTNGSGTVGALNITNVTVACTTVGFAVNANVSGLTGTGLLLQNNGGNNLAVNGNGTFAFTTLVATGSPYNVTVFSQPTGQTCSVTGGSGTMGSAAVTVGVTCVAAPTHTVGGTVSGLTASGLQLRNNGADTLTVASGATTFTFATQVAQGAAYNVTVFAQPTGLTCTVGSGSGTMGTTNITSVTVTCVATGTHTIGGTVSGLTGSGLQLRNNGGDTLSIGGNGGFTFATPVAVGATYSVSVFTQPSSPTQTCTVSNGSGTVGASNITNVSVSCSGGGGSGKFAFYANEGGTPMVASYSVGANGGFSTVSAIPVANNSVLGGAHATGVSVAGTSYVVVATDTDSQDGELQVYSLGSGGQLNFASRIRTDQPCGGGSHPSNSGGPCGLDNQSGTGPITSAPETVVIHPNGRFVYVMDGVAHGACNPPNVSPCSPPAGYPASGSRTIRRYTLDTSTGTLTYNDQHYCEGFIALAIDPQGRFLWCTSYLERRIYEFRIDQSTGALTFGTGTFIGMSDGDILLGIDPNGRYAYGFHEGDHTIDAYSIDQSNGHLTNLTDPSGGPNKVFGVSTSSLAVSASGLTLYTATSSGVVAYTLGSDGRILSVLGTYNPSGGVSGGWFRAHIGIGSNGQYLYVQGYNDPNVHIFSVNSSTGVLTETAASPSPVASGTAGTTQISLQ